MAKKSKKTKTKAKTKTRAKTKTTRKTIVALAVGDPTFSRLIDHPSKFYGVRPYVSGLVQGLARLKRTLGTDYVIDYRQDWHVNIESGETFRGMQKPALIFAMSTAVTRAVGKHAEHVKIVFPNCSEHEAEPLVKDKRATGFSARRTQNAGHCFDRFLKTVPTLEEVIILYRPEYHVAATALNLATKAAESRGIKVRPLAVRSHSELERELSNLPARAPGAAAKLGVFVTPVDLLFAEMPWIIKWVQEIKNLPAFLPVTDWVPSGFGGYGVPQFTCGERTAKQVDQLVWPKSGSRFPPVLVASEKDFEWVVSEAAAKALGVTLPEAEKKAGMSTV